MTQEEKQLLIQDLSARLPYGVIVHCKGEYNEYHKVEEIDVRDEVVRYFECMHLHEESIINCFPYLRPLSSMTEEEKKEYIEYAGYEIEESVNGRHYEYYLKDFCGTPDNPSVNTKGVDWLNKNMFDYRGLIPKGRAIEVTEDNNPYKD